MVLKERIERDLKDAMRAGDTLTRDTLRMVLSALEYKRIELGADLGEEQELAVLGQAVKSREDSAEQFGRAGRSDLEQKERAEIEVVQRYLPKRLSEEETRAIVQGLVAELGLESRKELGALMKAVMARHRSQVDGKLVQKLAAELLA